MKTIACRRISARERGWMERRDAGPENGNSNSSSRYEIQFGLIPGNSPRSAIEYFSKRKSVIQMDLTSTRDQTRSSLTFNLLERELSPVLNSQCPGNSEYELAQRFTLVESRRDCKAFCYKGLTIRKLAEGTPVQLSSTSEPCVVSQTFQDSSPGELTSQTSGENSRKPATSTIDLLSVLGRQVPPLPPPLHPPLIFQSQVPSPQLPKGYVDFLEERKSQLAALSRIRNYKEGSRSKAGRGVGEGGGACGGI
ncbi:hypothetical protein GYMLUDRAFT_253251 [Collybiopsis luxurians FD-317 M1]|uniref:Uncharacterized protein n=1 Tax=Collybiopsis luxurians FD-317 M1 TaxID=944289 RepID=A0A0D0AIZ3_9AGAR|nr:hypothetical protein GYMLUDRAFT_253251 [Collybiopsis luxurians FD-317 M1]